MSANLRVLCATLSNEKSHFTCLTSPRLASANYATSRSGSRRAGEVSCARQPYFHASAFLLALLFLLLFAAPAHAQSVQETALPAVQDAYVVQTDPSSNFGAAPELIVAATGVDGGAQTRTYVQWDLSRIPRNATITAARLEFFQRKGSTQTLVLCRASAAWEERTITFANAPRFSGCDDTWRPGDAVNQPILYDNPQLLLLVRNWLTGQAANDGLVLWTAAPNDTRVFDAREAGPQTAPVLRISYALPPIRVCTGTAVDCSPVINAEVIDSRTGAVLTTDQAGLIDSTQVAVGDVLWPRFKIASPTGHTALYAVGDAATVDAAQFVPYPGVAGIPEMRLVINRARNLLLYDFNLSAQWYLGDDPSRVDWLRTNLIKASNYLYDFTNGQFALGKVTVRQSYEGWDGANIKLHTNNTLHPNAVVGGIVVTDTPDVDTTIAITYTPGSIYMGSYWNRFGAPPGQPVSFQGVPVTQAEMDDDWAIALAHELSHYLLFLYDTYTDKNGVSNDAIAAACTGSAMGNAYITANHAFVADQGLWDSACGATEAHFRLRGRTEWATIKAWNSWVTVPAVQKPDLFPPAPLTTVEFITPATLPNPLASQVYTLTYRLNETSSGEARAFLIRDDSLIFEQGKPAKDATTVQLTDARIGDRLCVYDINDHAEDGETPRHQFGCKTVVAGDSNLAMTRNQAWGPEVQLEQTGPQQISVTVNQLIASAGAELHARLFPETGPAGAEQALTRSGNTWSTVFNLSAPVTPVYLQLWVVENPAAPQTRREVIADRGTGGDGAFGPARLHSGVMTVSSDGNAAYQSDHDIVLEPGQSIAWQSMPGTPPLNPWLRISGQSYRLDAFPSSLVAGGSVRINFNGAFGGMSAAGAVAPASALQPQVGSVAQAAIYFWNGSEWRKLPTTIASPGLSPEGPAGQLVATAPSQGVGVYAVLLERQPTLYLPQIKRE